MTTTPTNDKKPDTWVLWGLLAAAAYAVGYPLVTGSMALWTSALVLSVLFPLAANRFYGRPAAFQETTKKLLKIDFGNKTFTLRQRKFLFFFVIFMVMYADGNSLTPLTIGDNHSYFLSLAEKTWAIAVVWIGMVSMMWLMIRGGDFWGEAPWIKRLFFAVIILLWLFSLSLSYYLYAEKAYGFALLFFATVSVGLSGRLIRLAIYRIYKK